VQNGDTIQIAHVVQDIDKAMNYYYEGMGIGPWNVYELKQPLLRESYVHGRPSNHTYMLSLAMHNNMQYELIQPLTGRSIYDDFLEMHGEGLHHVKLYFDDCTAAITDFAKKGFSVIQSGKIDEDEFYYLDTDKTLGVIVELGNAGKIRPPERVFPAP
jgi:methylmalonyl-CoA/ethylmalonyl-CoA epimerase